MGRITTKKTFISYEIPVEGYKVDAIYLQPIYIDNILKNYINTEYYNGMSDNEYNFKNIGKIDLVTSECKKIHNKLGILEIEYKKYKFFNTI